MVLTGHRASWSSPHGLGCWSPSHFPGLTSRSRATVIKMAQPHIPARPRRWSVRRPARSTKNTYGESQGLVGRRGFGNRIWDGLGGWRQPRDVKPMVEAIPEASSYRDQGENCVDYTGSYGGIGWLPYPCRLEDAG